MTFGLQIFRTPRPGVAASINREDQGVTVRIVPIVTPLVAAIETDCVEATAVVVIVNVAVSSPPHTITKAGTCATAVLLLVSVTTIPPEGGGPFSVTVPVDGFPPFTLLGSRVRDDAIGAVTVKVAVRLTLL
jgi:hypothetical protein